LISTIDIDITFIFRKY